MNVVILAGGNGTRLKPILKDGQNKPFVKAFKNGEIHESITFRNLRLLNEVCPRAKVVVSTSKDYYAEAVLQLGSDISYCIEPSTRNTYAAIVLACCYMQNKNVGLDEIIIVCPSDFYVDVNYFWKFNNLEEKIQNENINVCLLGIKPYEVSDQFGYILKQDNNKCNFYEKPNLKKAEELIKSGAYWNAGVFAFKLSYMLNKINKEFGSTDYEFILHNFNNIKKISFDYEILEHEKNIDFVKYDGNWKDIGRPETFNSCQIYHYN